MSPSTTKITRSLTLATSNASFSRASPLSSSMPGVSIRCTPLPATSRQLRSLASRVVPCSTPTANASSPSNAFASADLPTLTRPNTAICSSPRSSLPSIASSRAKSAARLLRIAVGISRIVEQGAQAFGGLDAVRVAAWRCGDCGIVRRSKARAQALPDGSDVSHEPRCGPGSGDSRDTSRAPAKSIAATAAPTKPTCRSTRDAHAPARRR